MAVNMSRSQSAELAEGMSDGKYKKVVTAERGGEVEATTYANRRDLSDTWYGMHEARVKSLPDGTVHVTPEFVATPDANLY